jgi:hypothetical protein
MSSRNSDGRSDRLKVGIAQIAPIWLALSGGHAPSRYMLPSLVASDLGLRPVV